MNIASSPRIIIRKDPHTVTHEEWLASVNELRTGGMTIFQQKKILPIVKISVTKAVIYPGANSEVAYQLFCKALVDCIYPGLALQELEYFPTNFKKVITTFVQRTKSEGKYIFLKFISSILDWEDADTKLPYHFIRLGIANSHNTFMEPQPQVTTEYTIEEEAQIRMYGLLRIQQGLSRLGEESEIKVNYVTPYICLYTHYNKPISAVEVVHLRNWKDAFNQLDLNIGAKTKEAYYVMCQPQEEGPIVEA